MATDPPPGCSVSPIDGNLHICDAYISGPVSAYFLFIYIMPFCLAIDLNHCILCTERYLLCWRQISSDYSLSPGTPIETTGSRIRNQGLPSLYQQVGKDLLQYLDKGRLESLSEYFIRYLHPRSPSARQLSLEFQSCYPYNLCCLTSENWMTP
jgi:hypothetical protein